MGSHSVVLAGASITDLSFKKRILGRKTRVDAGTPAGRWPQLFMYNSGSDSGERETGEKGRDLVHTLESEPTKLSDRMKKSNLNAQLMRKVFTFTGKPKEKRINKITLKLIFFSPIKLASAFKTW